MISETEWLAAEERGKTKQESGLYAVAAHYDAQRQMMHVTFKRGFTLSFPKSRSQMMASATDDQLSEVEVQGRGWYIIFPKLDDGFTVEGVLAGRFGSQRWEEMWAAEHMEPQAA